MRKILKIAVLCLIIWLVVMVALSAIPSAHGQTPLPTMASTSWSATPTVPVPSPTPGNGDDWTILLPVYLPLISR